MDSTFGLLPLQTRHSSGASSVPADQPGAPTTLCCTDDKVACADLMCYAMCEAQPLAHLKRPCRQQLTAQCMTSAMLRVTSWHRPHASRQSGGQATESSQVGGASVQRSHGDAVAEAIAALGRHGRAGHGVHL